jgi:flagellar FliJ protein
MKRYRFRLESVLRVRRVQEDVARGDLARANTAVTAAAAALDAARHRLARTTSDPAPADAPEWQARRALLLGRAEEISARGADLEAATEARADRQRALAEARTRVRALERLDERRRAEHAVESARDESRTMDDLVTARWGRSS